VPEVGGYEHCNIILPELDVETGVPPRPSDVEKPKDPDQPPDQDKKSA